jgi:hypothetical protein
VSRPNVTDAVVAGLDFARACVLDQRAASHQREEHGWDPRYAAALAAIDLVVTAHQRAAKKPTKKSAKKPTKRSA